MQVELNGMMTKVLTFNKIDVSMPFDYHRRILYDKVSRELLVGGYFTVGFPAEAIHNHIYSLYQHFIGVPVMIINYFSVGSGASN